MLTDLGEIKILYLLLKKDLKESLKNRSALMIILLPLFASLMFSIVSSQPAVRNFEIALSGNDTQQLTSFINDNFENFRVENYDDLEAGKADTASGNIDAAIFYNSEAEELDNKYQIYLDSRDSINFFILKENITSLLNNYHGYDSGINYNFQQAGELKIRSSILPVWLTVTITMIGLMLISSSLAEEKEKKTLAALLVTKVNMYQVITAKTIFALILSIISSFLMGILNGVYLISLQRLFLLLLFIIIAGVVFSGLGLIISLFSSSQSAARSISTVAYFPIIFPALIADVSPLTEKIALFFPTHYFYRALDKILVYQGNNINLTFELSALILFAIIFYTIIFIYIRKADHFVN